MSHETTGIQELNALHEAARFDEVLSSYFRIPNAAAQRRRRHGPRRTTFQPDPTDLPPCPDTSLQQLKQLVRNAPTPIQAQYLEKLYTTIVYQLQRAIKTPPLFTRAVALCREIFKRSAVFRALIVTETAAFFEHLLVAAGELPKADVSRALRVQRRGSVDHVTMVLRLIETWKEDFGERYPSLVAGYAVLVERGYDFPNERERVEQEREHEAATRQKRQRVSQVKQQQRDREMKRYVVEMEQVLIEMTRAFEMLVPTLETFLVSNGQEEREVTRGDGKAAQVNYDEDKDTSGREGYDEDDSFCNVEWENAAVPSAAAGEEEEEEEEEEDVEWESVETDSGCTRDSALSYNRDEDNVGSDRMDINDIVQAYGLGSSSYRLTVEVSKQVCEESSENNALFRSLADGALRMRKRFLPLLNDWEQHSTTEPSALSLLSSQLQRQVLQQIRDLRDRITRVLLKWEDLVQGSNFSRQYASTRSAVVSLPLDAYNPPPSVDSKSTNTSR